MIHNGSECTIPCFGIEQNMYLFSIYSELHWIAACYCKYFTAGSKQISTNLEAAPPANLIYELPTVEQEGECCATNINYNTIYAKLKLFTMIIRHNILPVATVCS